MTKVAVYRCTSDPTRTERFACCGEPVAKGCTCGEAFPTPAQRALNAARKDAAPAGDVLAAAREEEIVFCDLNGTPDPYQTPGNRRTRREADALKARHAVAFAGRRAAAETASTGRPVPAPDPYATGLKALRESYGATAARPTARPSESAPPDPYAASIEAHRRALGVA